MSLTIRIHRSIEAIPREDWVRIMGEEVEGYDYFRVLEKSALAGFSFAYIDVLESGSRRLLAPVFWGDLDLCIGVEGVVAKFLKGLRRLSPRLLMFRTLFVGSPFGEHGQIGWAGPACEAPERYVSALLEACEQLSQEQELSFLLFKDFEPAAMKTLASLEDRRFIRGESFPNIVLPLDYPSMEAYVASLSANTRKELRRKVRKAEQQSTWRVELRHSVEDILDDVYALYLQTYDAGTVHFEKLTPDYFRQVGRLQAEQARFFLFYAGERLVCFNLCFQQGTTLVDKFIGMDYAVARNLNLYFYTWHHNVQWCLAQGIRSYQVGQTDYEAKRQLGGRKSPLGYYARHRRPWLNALLRRANAILEPSS